MNQGDRTWGVCTEDRVIELMTSGDRVGGRPEAKEILRQLRREWGREIVNRQMTAHEEARPSFHGVGVSCQPAYDCHVRHVIKLAIAATEGEGRD